MLRLMLVVLLAFGTGFAVAAKVADNGPPYTDAQFLELSKERMPTETHATLPEWWKRAPDYLRRHVLSSPSEMWWPIIKCNYLGFRPDATGPTNSAKCEKDFYDNTQRGKKSWSPDGQWVGPSEACIKRDKRSQYGELICD